MNVCIHWVVFIFSFNLHKNVQGYICIPLNLLDFGTGLNDCKERPPVGTFYVYLGGSFTLLEQ